MTLKNLIQKLTPKKKDVPSIIVGLVITLFFFLGLHFLGVYFAEFLWVIIAGLLGLLLSIIMVKAGLTVLKSLFVVGAEISLLIFLAQSYCAVPNRLAAGDTSLKSLLIVGILYIAGSFCYALYDELKKDHQRIAERKWSKEKAMTISLYLTFTLLFIWQIYRVVGPIILNLCVYQ